MYAYTKETLSAAEAAAAAGDAGAVWRILRGLCLDDFGELLLHMPSPDYPGLSSVLPHMAAAEVQNNWTGNNGYPLLAQTLSFVRSVDYHFLTLAGRRLDGAKILDFGCGFGRIARLMYYFTDPDRFFGVDPWYQSIRLCKESRLPGTFLISDYVPRDLPVTDRDFDLIYCFSVFTHLSMRTTRAALTTLRAHIAPGGLLVITIRPEEYWHRSAVDPFSGRTADDLLAEHRATGFAFNPHRRDPIDGDITYGDTSMTIDWLTRECPEWTIRGLDRTLDDPLQILLFLSPR